MDCTFEQYLNDNGFEKWFKKLSKKLENKTIIIYAAGALFKYIKNNYNLENFNVIGISDKKFSKFCNQKEYLGYNIILLDDIARYKPDYVLVASQKYIGIVKNMTQKVFCKTKIKVLPLVKKPLLTTLKEIWS